MNEVLRRDAEAVVRSAIDAVRPDAAVRRALAAGEQEEDHVLRPQTTGHFQDLPGAAKTPMLARKAKEVPPGTGRTALIAGGETVVHLTGNGLGGRNQEIALAAAEELRGVRDAALISVGSGLTA